MFDFLQMFNFGSEIEAHGEKWLSVQYLQNRCHLAIKPDDSFPCQVFLIRAPEEKKPDTDQPTEEP